MADQLGTPRMIFDKTGSLASTKRHDYLPFGEELFAGIGGRTTALGYTGDTIRQQFTLKERHIETGLDYFGARYYASTQGRFTSVDLSRKSISVGNPQTWNRSSYTYNNPLAFVDNNGKWPTEIHRRIIDKAFPGLTERQRNALKIASRRVDNDQSTEGAYKHAMRAPGQSILAAAFKATIFMHDAAMKARKEQSRYEELGGRGVSRQALSAAGEAIHTATDNTSPVHSGFQVWRGLIGKDILETFMLLRQAARHQAGESTITDEEFDEAVKAAQEVYRIIFGEKLYKDATTAPKTSPKAKGFQGESLFEYEGDLMLRPDWSSDRFRRIGCIE